MICHDDRLMPSPHLLDRCQCSDSHNNDILPSYTFADHYFNLSYRLPIGRFCYVRVSLMIFACAVPSKKSRFLSRATNRVGVKTNAVANLWSGPSAAGGRCDLLGLYFCSDFAPDFSRGACSAIVVLPLLHRHLRRLLIPRLEIWAGDLGKG